MLRSATLAIAAIGFVLGLIAVLAWHVSGAIVAVCWGAIIVAGIIFERVRYKPTETAKPGGDFEPTAERFLDEEGRAVTVWIDRKTGERKYVAG